MEKIKIQDIETGAVKEVKKSLAGDFIGTGKFKIYDEKKSEKKNSFVREEKPNNILNKEEK